MIFYSDSPAGRCRPTSGRSRNKDLRAEISANPCRLCIHGGAFTQITVGTQCKCIAKTGSAVRNRAARQQSVAELYNTAGNASFSRALQKRSATPFLTRHTTLKCIILKTPVVALRGSTANRLQEVRFSQPDPSSEAIALSQSPVLDAQPRCIRRSAICRNSSQ